jgi:hypothetical protein
MTHAEMVLIAKLVESKHIPESIAEYIVSFINLKQKQIFRACLAQKYLHSRSSGDMELAMYGKYLIFRGPAFMGRRPGVTWTWDVVQA